MVSPGGPCGQALLVNTAADFSSSSGQMIYFDDWKMILFLGTPVMPDLEAMVHTGLFINDLSMHDFSR